MCLRITDKRHGYLDLELLHLIQLKRVTEGKQGRSGYLDLELLHLIQLKRVTEGKQGRRPSGLDGSTESEAISRVEVAGAAAA
jgi:hypothetical protein